MKKATDTAVRSDIPIPEVRRGRKPVHRFDRLDRVGKSIWLESSIQSIHSCLSLFIKNHEPTWRFKAKKERNGVRVWRTE